jgi:hypothetical protein
MAWTEGAVTKLEELKAMSERGELTYARAHSECLARQQLINTMVGWLYPSILRDEICAIRDLVGTRPR